MFAFHFVIIGPILAEIKQIPYLTLKNLGQGHNEIRPKSNQVIYRSGPTIVPKMKEIQKVVQKLSCEQKSSVKSIDIHLMAISQRYLSHQSLKLIRLKSTNRKFDSNLPGANTKVM